ncbi:uncharacterized protein LOC143038606 [Oratosquilla oratoria]|uniref:uncharacterized protein LOC143038606 n=1 Tax=Oratosquilla oratoria TaxID=337810 RepID=UPI003F7647FA
MEFAEDPKEYCIYKNAGNGTLKAVETSLARSPVLYRRMPSPALRRAANARNRSHSPHPRGSSPRARTPRAPSPHPRGAFRTSSPHHHPRSPSPYPRAFNAHMRASSPCPSVPTLEEEVRFPSATQKPSGRVAKRVHFYKSQLE